MIAEIVRQEVDACRCPRRPFQSARRPTPAMQLTGSIRQLQSLSRGNHPPLDPALVSAYVNASLFAFWGNVSLVDGGRRT
jgi:hypothetical protein